MSRILFTANERNIIELLRRNECLSKAQLAEMGGMSWATVVKMTNRLLERKAIIPSGTGVNKSKPGKKETLLFICNRKDYSFWNDRSTSDFR